MDPEDYSEWVDDPAPLPPTFSNNFQQSRSGGSRGRGGSYGGNRSDNSWQDNKSNGGWESNNVDNGWKEDTCVGFGNRDDGFSDIRGRGRGRGRGGRDGGRGRGGGRNYDSWQDNNDSDFGGGGGGWNDDGGSFGGGERRGRGGGRNRYQDGADDGWGDSGAQGRGRGRAFSSGNDGGDYSNARDGGRSGSHGARNFGSDSGTFDGRGDGKATDGPDDKPKERYIPPDPTDDENVMFDSNISSGINFSKYDDIQVKVSGENVPDQISSFQQCGLRTILLDNIKKSHYTTPTPVQKYAIPIILEGRDLMACAQTGSGKTAAFLLPILHKLLETSPEANPGRTVDPQVVICSPTRELSIQIFNEARKFAHGSSLKICIAYGGTVVAHQSQVVKRGCNVLVATPGRLNDFVSRSTVTFSSVKFFVLDEADRMLDMGFLPEIERMLQHESMRPLGERQTLMFSATFPEQIQHLAGNYLYNYLFLAVGIVGGACADVEQVFYEVPKFEKRTKLVEIMGDHTSNEKQLTVVFVQEKRTADFIAAFLCENNFPTTSIHGDRLQSQREMALADFKSGRMPILVATAVAARGLDIKNVAHVVNYDLPKSIEEYVHRIGRTGRLGNRGRATSLYDPNEDSQLASSLVRILKQTGQEVPTFLQGAKGFSSSDFEFSSDQAFGGHDVRGAASFKSTPSGVPCAVEEEESW